MALRETPQKPASGKRVDKDFRRPVSGVGDLGASQGHQGRRCVDTFARTILAWLDQLSFPSPPCPLRVLSSPSPPRVRLHAAQFSTAKMPSLPRPRAGGGGGGRRRGGVPRGPPPQSAAGLLKDTQAASEPFRRVEGAARASREEGRVTRRPRRTRGGLGSEPPASELRTWNPGAGARPSWLFSILSFNTF